MAGSAPINRRGVRQEAFARNFTAANIGVLTGPSRLTVVDCDDESTLAEAEQHFGRSPLVTRSPRGGVHLWFRSTGERNANLRPDGLNIDIRGLGGLIVVPPSVRKGKGQYRIERGSWDALETLPAILTGAIPERHMSGGTAPQSPLARLERIGEVRKRAGRNDALFRALMGEAQNFRVVDEVVFRAHALNESIDNPMEAEEVEKVAQSVCGYWQRGELWHRNHHVAIPVADLDVLAGNGDATLLYLHLKRHHGARNVRGEQFAVSCKPMAAAGVIPNWGVGRYRSALDALIRTGLLVQAHVGGRCRGDAARFLLAKGRPTRPNVTDTLPLPLSAVSQGTVQ